MREVGCFVGKKDMNSLIVANLYGEHAPQLALVLHRGTVPKGTQNESDGMR